MKPKFKGQEVRYTALSSATEEELTLRFKEAFNTRENRGTFRGLLFFIQDTNGQHELFSIGEPDLDVVFDVVGQIIDDETEEDIVFERDDDEERIIN